MDAEPTPKAMPTELELSMMQHALDAADRAAAMGEVPVGCVIHRGQEVLSVTHNLRESHNDPTAHAEILALREAATKLGSWRLDDCTLVVTLEPCPMCAGAMVNARVPRLVYGADDPKMGCVRSLHRLCDDPRFNHRMTIVADVMAEQAAQQLRAFFRARRGGPRTT